MTRFDFRRFRLGRILAGKNGLLKKGKGSDIGQSQWNKLSINRAAELGAQSGTCKKRKCLLPDTLYPRHPFGVP